MVMNFTVFDASLHMTNHYRRINSAKCVVNTSAPRCYNYRQKCTSDKGSTSRLSTASVLSNYGRVPSRTNSNCEVRREVHNRSNLLPAGRSSSVPPRPVSKRNPSMSSQRKPKLQITKAPSKKLKLPTNTDTKTNDSSKHTVIQEQLIREPTEDLEENVHLNEESSCGKKPVPTPRTMSQLHVPLVSSVLPDYEYLQFSLRITEDIIRNDLYSQREMRRVFNSHIEANRDRLSMTIMLQTIDNLCKELNISKKVSRHIVNHEKFSAPDCSCAQNKQQLSRTSNKLSQSSKQTIIEKLVNGQYEITDEEIKGFSENELQQVITGIMSDEHVDECISCDGLQKMIVQNLISPKSMEENVDIPQVSFRSSNTSNTDFIEANGNDEKEIVQANSAGGIQSVEESSTSNVMKGNNSETALNDTKSSHLVCENHLLKQESSSCVHLQATSKFIETVVIEENNSYHVQSEELSKTNIIANEVCKSYESRSHSLLAEAETVLKQVISKIPSWNSVPSSRLSTEEIKDSTIITSSPVRNASNISVENVEFANSLLSVDTSHPALLTETDIMYDLNEHKSNNVSLGIVQKTEEYNVIEKNAINSDAVNESLKQEKFDNIRDGKQHHEVSINTEQSVVDSCTQYDLVNMENSLELGIDKCTQTSFYDEKAQYLNIPAQPSGNSSSTSSSSSISVVCTSSAEHCANESCTIPHRADTHNEAIGKEFIVEVTPVASNQLVSNESQTVNAIRIDSNEFGSDVKISNPPSEFVSTIKQMLLENVTALSEIMGTPRRNSRKSLLAPDHNENKHGEIFLRSIIPVINVTDVELTNDTVHVNGNNENDVSMSEGEITGTSTDRSKVKSRKDVSNLRNYLMTNSSSKCECKVLKHLKKYEHNQSVLDNDSLEPRNISLSDYELKICEDKYLPQVRRDAQYLFPNIATGGTMHSQRKFNIESLSSDGELRSSSTPSDYDTRTDTS